MKGLYDEAIDELQKGLASPEVSRSQEGWILAELGYTYGLQGKREKAADVLKKLKARDDPWHLLEVAKVYAGLGERDEAFAWLARAADERFPFFWELRSDPEYESLRPDPRYRELLRRINL